MVEKEKRTLDLFYVMFKPRYKTSKWLENITRGLVTETVFRLWLDREILPTIRTNYRVINIGIFNPPHSYHPRLKNPFFDLIGDTPDFAIAHMEELDGEYGKGLVGLHQYDRFEVIIDIKCERGFHPGSTTGICERNCKRFKECVGKNEKRGWFPQSQVGQFNKFYNLISANKPKFGFIAWFPLPVLDKITIDIVQGGLVEHCYACVVLGSNFLMENHTFFKIFDNYVDWNLFAKNIRWVLLDENGKPSFEDYFLVQSERGQYRNICFNVDKAMTTNQMIDFVSKKAPDIFINKWGT